MGKKKELRKELARVQHENNVLEGQVRSRDFKIRQLEKDIQIWKAKSDRVTVRLQEAQRPKRFSDISMARRQVWEDQQEWENYLKRKEAQENREDGRGEED